MLIMLRYHQVVSCIADSGFCLLCLGLMQQLNHKEKNSIFSLSFQESSVKGGFNADSNTTMPNCQNQSGILQDMSVGYVS